MEFQEKVWQLVQKIPKGKATTYKILAERLGTKAYRAVGAACAKNPQSPVVPCHRVVSSNGFVGNFSSKGGKAAKIKLLKEEGVQIKDGKILNFDEVLFTF